MLKKASTARLAEKTVFISEEDLRRTASQLGLGGEEFMRIVEIANLMENVEYKRTILGVEILTAEAEMRLKKFLHAADRIWKTLATQVRFWRAKRLAIRVQSSLRTYLAIARENRLSRKIPELQGLLALLSNIQVILGPKRRAAIKIQNFYRMIKSRTEYKVLRWLKIRHEAAVKIQKTFRGAYTREHVRPELARQRMLRSIKIMQASIRRFMCTEIIYLSALKRLQNRSASTIQTFFRKLKFKQKLKLLAGLKFLAVRAKFIAFLLAEAQVRIARVVRSFLVRKHFPEEMETLANTRLLLKKNSSNASVPPKYKPHGEAVSSGNSTRSSDDSRSPCKSGYGLP